MRRCQDVFILVLALVLWALCPQTADGRHVPTTLKTKVRLNDRALCTTYASFGTDRHCQQVNLLKSVPLATIMNATFSESKAAM